jgi:hypothetical protein
MAVWSVIYMDDCSGFWPDILVIHGLGISGFSIVMEIISCYGFEV